MMDSTDAVLRALWRDKMHVEPATLDLVPPSIRASYDHIWHPAQVLMAELRPLPLGLLGFWRDSPAGHLVFTHRPSCYRPGPQPWRDASLYGLCELSIIELREDPSHVMRVLFSLFDHLLGSEGLNEGAWLSDGAGATAPLRRLGVRLLHIYNLGHWQGAFPVRDPHAYLAYTWWLYLHDPRRLNAADPLMYKLLATTLMSQRFWAVRARGESTVA